MPLVVLLQDYPAVTAGGGMQEAAHVRYMALIFSEESKRPESEEGQQALERAHRRFTRSAQAAGVLVGGEALQVADTATVVRARDKGTLVTDGAFSGDEAVLDGYYVLECDNLDQAIEWAARIPEAATGAIEVRPVRGAH